MGRSQAGNRVHGRAGPAWRLGGANKLIAVVLWRHLWCSGGHLSRFTRLALRTKVRASVRILIVEDQTMFRELLAAACAQVVEQADLRLAADGAAALVACRSCAPDLVVLDLELPDIDGLDLLGELRMLAPRLRVIVLSSHTDEFSLHRATLAQVNGFVDKDGQPVVILAEAIREVSAGRQYLSPIVHQVKLAMRNDPAAFNKVLTDREVEMLALIGAGAPDDEIAARFSLRPITVKNHRRNILSKLGLHSTPDLMRYALEKGFVRIRRRRPPAVAPAP